MSWLIITISAYLILAIVNLADKFLLDKILPSTKTYTFLVGVLGLVVIIIAPWFLHWPGFYLFLGNLIIGALFPLALLALYKSLKEGEASTVITLIGGTIPIFTIILSIIFLGEKFSRYKWWGIVLLLLGSVIIAWFPEAHSLWTKVLRWFKIEAERKWYGIILAVAAAFILAVFFVGTKYLYSHQPFLSSFIWIRLGSFVAVMFLLFNQNNRREISGGLKKLKGHNKYIFLSNQGLAAVGFLLQNYAIFLGSVALVNALQGVQYAFLLVFGGLISIFYPKLVKERVSKYIILQKIIAVVLIGCGLYFIAA
ncbi:MAG: hypothetical protein COU21_00800 [Candidatus Komeilibacteria bacterium CG10_big_fil_rev_8_21_14_0_10_36_65]|nr:MAG: hypothetical protein COU21_00800 [Candidatus Komeilibacteria bacterium CG10_big_fil_rev_8_21_14_0_10_36_65]PJC55765.1 MAG: hypothetical protein CO027_00385 [Candidatus Komeilibacteria bacterium CG_4_9_14_0_2_um_filter_36_13]